jgi:hypothetical protein
MRRSQGAAAQLVRKNDRDLNRRAWLRVAWRKNKPYLSDIAGSDPMSASG